MKTPTTVTPSDDVQRIGLCFLTAALLVGVGCVSQHRYDEKRAEVDEIARTLDATRTDVKKLVERIESLQVANRREDAVATDLRTAIQREEEMLPIRRQRGDDQLAALQTQVARLVNQSRLLTREMANARQESASLKVLVAQYTQEIEESESLSMPLESAASTPAHTQPTMTDVIPPVPQTNETVLPQQTAQANPLAPMTQTTQPRPVEVEPAPIDDSWIGMIMSWLASLWSWIFD